MDLFGDGPPGLPGPAAPASAKRRKPARPAGRVLAADALEDDRTLALALGENVFLGTSTWSFPGWGPLVWGGAYSDAALAREGLPAYAGHPLLRAVGIDRSFYRPLSADEYARYAAQVPPDFRFVVKAPALVTDALLRDGEGRSRATNPGFMDPTLAIESFVRPVLDGLGERAGALVFQFSPLPPAWTAPPDRFLEGLGRMLAAVREARGTHPAVLAVELRNPEFVTPALAKVLKDGGATWCLGVHPRMPPVEAQLPMLRALWPGPLVCRWSLNARHGAHGYAAAKQAYGNFDALVDPDPATRSVLARVLAATAGCGLPALVTINNKAEGSAPLSVRELARQAARAMAKAPAHIPGRADDAAEDTDG